MIQLDAYLDKIKHLIPAAAELDLEIIEGGYSNHAYLLSWQEEKQCVLRIPGLDEKTFLLCRFAEKRALDNAIAQLLSPPCWYFDAYSGVMVSQYVPQVPFEWDVYHDELTVIRLAKGLQKIHQSPSNQAEYQLENVINTYLENAAFALEKTDVLELHKSPINKQNQQFTLSQLACEIKWLQQFSQPYLTNITHYEPVMCHNDLNPKNCLADAMHFWIIDWEYAGEGDPLFDIALVFAAHNFTPEQKRLFFQHYESELPLANLMATLDNYQILYKVREMAWMLLKYATSHDEKQDVSVYHLFKDELINSINLPNNSTDENRLHFERIIE